MARVTFALLVAAGVAVAVALVRPSGPDAGANSSSRAAEAASVFAEIDFRGEAETAARAAEARRRERRREAREALVPGAEAMRAAAAYAEERGGLVSFAVIDSRGHLRGHDVDRLYSAASVVKAMVLAAELRRLDEQGAEVDDATASLLDAMITISDNGAADAVYARVGDEGMHAVAKGVGMNGFTIAGHWGNAQVTAADMARFFAELDDVFPERHVEYGRRLLASIDATQSWGIPVAAGDRWAARFKGGWLPDHALVHQAAELRERGGPRQISLAVMTDEQPSHGYAVETVEGVATRLLAPD